MNIADCILHHVKACPVVDDVLLAGIGRLKEDGTCTASRTVHYASINTRSVRTAALRTYQEESVIKGVSSGMNWGSCT